MYGYVMPDKPNMYIKDFADFKAYYCGLCKCIGKECGQLMRFTTNYDATILNVLLHNILEEPVAYKRSNCILHPISKRTVLINDKVTRLVVDINNILMYHKVVDDTIDGGHKFRKTVKNVMYANYKKASKKYTEIDNIISDEYSRLRIMENADEKIIDKVSDCFGSLMMRMIRSLIGDKCSQDIENFSYNLGKWIYCIDAIDDLEEDRAEKRYNPFLAAFEGFVSREQFLEDNKEKITYIFNMCLNEIKSSYDLMNITISEGVLTNTIYYGLPTMTKEILWRKCKCKKNRF